MNEGIASSSIDEGIHNLQYDPLRILSVKGEPIQNLPSSNSKLENDKYYVITYEKAEAINRTYDIGVVNALQDITYPGSLLLANRNLVNNTPDFIVALRKPLTFHIELPLLGESSIFTVQNPSYGTISAGIQETLKKWFELHPDIPVPSNQQFLFQKIYSEEQLDTMLGASVKDSLNNMGQIDFKALTKGEKQMILIKYTQIFYNVSVNPPNKPSDYFADSVTFDDLVKKGVNNENPPVYVRNVSYGRSILIKLETTSKSSSFEEAIKASFRKDGVTITAEQKLLYNSIYQSTNYTVVSLGGNPTVSTGLLSVDADLKELSDVISKNAEFNKNNPGYPLFYTTTFLKNGITALTNSSCEYVKVFSTEYSKGMLKLRHTGGYVAAFHISWYLETYTNGVPNLTLFNWAGSGKGRTSGFEEEISLPANTKKIAIRVRVATGLIWDRWHTILERTNLPLCDVITLSIWGTTLHTSKKLLPFDDMKLYSAVDYHNYQNFIENNPYMNDYLLQLSNQKPSCGRKLGLDCCKLPAVLLKDYDCSDCYEICEPEEEIIDKLDDES